MASSRQSLREKSEVARRIIAARTLRGWEQHELDALCAAEDLRKDLAGALERGERDFRRDLDYRERKAFASLLRVSLDWFDAPLERLLAVPAVADEIPERDARVDQLERSVERLQREVGELLAAEQARQRQTKGRESSRRSNANRKKRANG